MDFTQRDPQPQSSIANSACYEQIVTNARATAGWGGCSSTANCGEAEDCWGISWEGYSIATDERDIEGGECSLQLRNKARIPVCITAQAIAHQHRKWHSALRGQVREVYGKQLPRNIFRRIGRQIMHALCQHIVREDQSFKQRGIIVQPTRCGVSGEGA